MAAGRARGGPRSRCANGVRTTWLVAAVLLAGCAGPADPEERGAPASPGTPTVSASPDREEDPGDGPGRRPRDAGVAISLGESHVGPMLFDANRQAIYLFRPEADGTPACYDACAEAWPPVLTEGPPEALRGVDEELLGTVRRRDGSRQVTYNDWPLYFYAHEGPGEVLCHDVFLNGGLWLALGADGRPRPA